jgi:hypothetical protein
MALIVLCVVLFLFVLYVVLHEMCDSYVSTLPVAVLDYSSRVSVYCSCDLT